MAEKRWMPERAIVKLVVSLVVFIVLIVFAIQNFHRHGAIKILFWETGETPISIIIFVSILIGALIAIAALLPHILRLQRRAKRAGAEASRLRTGPPKSGDLKETAG